MITIHLNGDVRHIPATTDLTRLVQELSLSDKRVAVELNGRVVRKLDWPDTVVNDGDRIEIVHFVGGG